MTELFRMYTDFIHYGINVFQCDYTSKCCFYTVKVFDYQNSIWIVYMKNGDVISIHETDQFEYCDNL